MQLWVPDVKSATFIRDARQQSKLVAGDRHERDEQAFIDAISDWNPA